MIRLADGARIEHAHALDDFIARDMGVSVQENVTPPEFGNGGRNMDQTEAEAVSFQGNFQRPELSEIIVSLHDDDRRAEALDAFQNLASADIAKMPDLIGPGDCLAHGVRKNIVSVGNDGDPKGPKFGIHSAAGLLLINGGEVARCDPQDFLNGGESE